MSKQVAKGSIVLELLIVVLTAALIAVILIPGKIWNEQKQEEITAHDNMMSIYEAEKYYKKLTGKFTSDPAQLIKVVHEDSILNQKQKIVNYTRELIRSFNSYLTTPYIKHILRIKSNSSQIIDDLESNRYHFKTIEEINNEANELKIMLGNFLNAPELPNFVHVLMYVDSLMQVHQTLSDFSLQVNALKIAAYTDSLQKYLPQVQPAKVHEKWSPLSDRLAAFVKTVKRSELVRVTSVADRVEDFRKRIDDSFEKLLNLDTQQEVQKVEQLSANLDSLYQKFLKDYNITSKLALSKLSESDSLIIHLTEKNFYSPVNGEMYKILIDPDSQFVKIESPVLVAELKDRLMPIVDEVKQMPFMPAFEEYLSMYDSVLNKANIIRKKFRKNTDLFILYKELEGEGSKYADLSVVSAYKDLKDFVETVPQSESFSEMKKMTENSLNGVRIFNQAYTENVFGNLDSVHTKVVKKMDEFNDLLDQIRKKSRRARKILGDLKAERQAMDSLFTRIKTAGDPATIEKLKEMEKALGETFLFASEGKKIRVYGVFDKEIKNFGYIYKDVKSWEEEKNK